MTPQEAHEEIAYINRLPIEDVQRQYKVDTRQEAIDLINEEIEEEVEDDDFPTGDIWQEHGFLSAKDYFSYRY